jgi:hypothetical protein
MMEELIMLSAKRMREKATDFSFEYASKARKNFYKFLKTLEDDVRDMYNGEIQICNLDAAYLEEDDYDTAFNAACAVLAYKVYGIYGASAEDEEQAPGYTPINVKDYKTFGGMLEGVLLEEYGNQIHNIVAVRAQMKINMDMGEG